MEQTKEGELWKEKSHYKKNVNTDGPGMIDTSSQNNRCSGLPETSFRFSKVTGYFIVVAVVVVWYFNFIYLE